MSRILPLILCVLVFCLIGCASASTNRELPSQKLDGIGDLTHIFEIQGAGHISPFNRGKVENVPGIISAILPTRGFYMQNPLPDDSDATSEGIFVKYRKVQTLSVGDLVLVAGKVDEYYPGGESTGGLSVTRIKLPEIAVLGSGYEVPNAAILGTGGRIPPSTIICDDAEGDVEESRFDPEADGIDFFESLESMVVQVNNSRVVGNIHTLYGEFQVVGDDGAHASVSTPRGGLVLREGDFNPERIVVDVIEDISIVSHPENMHVAVGDRFEDPIRGVVSYAFGLYKILPTTPLPEIQKGDLARDTLFYQASADELTVGTFNIENYSGRSSEAKTTDIAETIAVAMGGPDIIAIPEIQDDNGSINDGTTTAHGTAGKLAAAIRHFGGPHYSYIDVEPEDGRDGGEPGGNIRVGMLYNPDRVSFAKVGELNSSLPAGFTESGGTAFLSPNPARIEPGNAAFAASRKPIVARFLFRDRPVYVIAVHFNSKGGDGELFGRTQPPVFATEGKRGRQAESVASFIRQIRVKDAEAGIIVTGDFNDFHFSKTLEIIADDFLVNVAQELLEPNQLYTYVFEGNSQTLDHILVSPNLYNDDTKTQILHRYSEYMYGERQSDHDPVVAALVFDWL